MKRLLSVAMLAGAWTAWSQGNSEAILSYSNNSVVATVNATIGWSFQPNIAFTITNLGCFNYFFNNPTITNIQVGLWDSAGGGTLLASNTITPNSVLVDQSRYESITPVAVNPTHTYNVGVFYPGGTLGFEIASPAAGGSVVPSAEILLRGAAQASSDFVFALPVALPGYEGVLFAGPNFRYEGRLPEPSSWVLLGLGGCLLVVRRRRRPL